MLAIGTDSPARGLGEAIGEFRHVWRHLRSAARDSASAGGCPSRWVIERLLRMAAAQGPAPASGDLSMQVRLILEEAEFAGVCDAPADTPDPHRREEQVRLVIRTLEVIRSHVTVEPTTVTPSALPPWVRC